MWIRATSATPSIDQTPLLILNHRGGENDGCFKLLSFEVVYYTAMVRFSILKMKKMRLSKGESSTRDLIGAEWRSQGLIQAFGPQSPALTDRHTTSPVPAFLALQ